ncbi:MAG TPA: glycosyltransferase [Oscillospiraceae bacterium]|nr:glycosyltransferase [Oscillospiraceae bacterium]HPF54936.1 glycosyltransferase [Clostridiales bacterium]HPK34995.1 glycosyltransferase [Oscillospiraceae bacterium]HPR75553.1 glycosyltransferase [Oscillospiraceae bacterium]
MRIAEINMLSSGSTGNIMLNIAKCARGVGIDARTYSTHVFSKKYTKCPPAPTGHKYFGTYFENGLHFILTRITGCNGCFSYFGTQRLIDELKEYKPDAIHLHNLHQFCFHLPSLFRYLKSSGTPVVWTLHDCWTFTGQCPHFLMAGCNKWKTGCHHCPQFREYPKSYMDQTKRMYKLKKKWFCSIPNMTLVTPSQWLADLVKQSFLGEYPVRVINNGIDLHVFKPTPSDFRERYGLTGKRLILGVAYGWGPRKGLDIFIDLSKRLDPEKYQIILVGTNDKTDKLLPPEIISIHRTQNQKELAEIYTAADVFANPTREDNFPTVNIESLACGTPVITFNSGGSPEIPDETCGLVVSCNDIDTLYDEIVRVCETKPFSEEACLKRARSFDMNNKFMEYVRLCREEAL